MLTTVVFGRVAKNPITKISRQLPSDVVARARELFEPDTLTELTARLQQEYPVLNFNPDERNTIHNNSQLHLQID